MEMKMSCWSGGGREIQNSMVYLKSGVTPDKTEHEANLKRRAGQHGWERPHAEDGHRGEEGARGARCRVVWGGRW